MCHARGQKHKQKEPLERFAQNVNKKSDVKAIVQYSSSFCLLRVIGHALWVQGYCWRIRSMVVNNEEEENNNEVTVDISLLALANTLGLDLM